MLLTAQSERQAATKNGRELAVLEVDPIKWSQISSLLEVQGYRVRNYNSTTEAIASFREHERPALLILAIDSTGTSSPPIQELFALAREQNLPTLAILEPDADLKTTMDQDVEIFDWVSRGSLPIELPARVEGLLRRQARKEEVRGPSASTMPTDSRFFR